MLNHFSTPNGWLAVTFGGNFCNNHVVSIREIVKFLDKKTLQINKKEVLTISMKFDMKVGFGL